MFLSCEVCGEDIFADHLEFHMAEHVGMGTALQLFRHNQEEKKKGSSEGEVLPFAIGTIELLVHRIGFKRRLL